MAEVIGNANLDGIGDLTADAIMTYCAEGLIGQGEYSLCPFSSAFSKTAGGCINATASLLLGGISSLNGIGSLSANALLNIGGDANLDGIGIVIVDGSVELAGVSIITDPCLILPNVSCSQEFCDTDPPWLLANDKIGILCESMCEQDRVGWRFREGQSQKGAWVAAITVCNRKLWLNDQRLSGQPVIGIPTSQKE